MRFDVIRDEWLDPRCISQWECPTCGTVWDLVYSGDDEKWYPQGGGFPQDEEPMIGDKCPGCILDGMTGEQLIAYAEENDRKALVLRGLLSVGGKPLSEDDPVVEWAWECFKNHDPEPLAEAVKDALWYERENMVAYLRECG